MSARNAANSNYVRRAGYWLRALKFGLKFAFQKVRAEIERRRSAIRHAVKFGRSVTFQLSSYDPKIYFITWNGAELTAKAPASNIEQLLELCVAMHVEPGVRTEVKTAEVMWKFPIQTT